MGSCDCGKGCAKCLLILFNVIFFLTGAALLAVGIWVRVDASVWEFIDFASVNQDDKFIEYGAYLIIAVGGFILLTGFLGCCGAIRESKLCLGLYIFILVVVFLAEIASGVLVIIFQDKVKDDFRTLVTAEFQDNGTFYRNDDGWSGFATSMNLVQKEFKCCGIQGPEDYIVHATYGKNLLTCGEVPCSCFELKDAKNDRDPNELTDEDVDVEEDRLHTKGCETEIIDFFEQYSVIFIGLAIGFACIEVFGLIFAVCLCVIGGKGE